MLSTGLFLLAPLGLGFRFSFPLLVLAWVGCLSCPLAFVCGLGILGRGPSPWQTLAQPSKQHRALSRQSTSVCPTLQQSEFLPWQAETGGMLETVGQEPVGLSDWIRPWVTGSTGLSENMHFVCLLIFILGTPSAPATNNN